jgi:hypothetical protein
MLRKAGQEGFHYADAICAAKASTAVAEKVNFIILLILKTNALSWECKLSSNSRTKTSG